VLAAALVSTLMVLKTSLFQVSTAALTVSFSSQLGISASLKAQAFALEMNEIPTFERNTDGVAVLFQVKSAPTVS
jgi:hypothetical protein